MSAANFSKCLDMLLHHEGGFVNHPDDPGGMTNLGVTKAVYEKYIKRNATEAEMRALTKIDVSPIYRSNYWDRGHCDDLPSGVDWSVFDWGVNSGMGRAAKALQRVVGVTADGAIGPMTIKATHDMKPQDVIVKMHSSRQSFYESLTTFKTFGRGWSRRNDETLEAALEMAGE
jgi:lysozyme family protein